MSESGPANRLAQSTSPYLLLHQHNPVDWFPWGEEALARARELDRPIFLSVGYSTCYWCHVMERESFSDPQTAELMNAEFVSIKMDREERPELDEIYMAATQLISGHGGWPNSVFLTPKLEPFYAGTYFPPEDRQGLPAFRTVLSSLAEAWKTRRDEVEEQAAGLANSMRRFLEERGEPVAAVPGREYAERSLAALERRYDPDWGGFGGAPKFPTPSNLYLLLDVAGEHPHASEMLTATLDQMARGGIYDQLAGGFHRYATDREWRIPHFEKMLYDNGLLLEIYAREAVRTGDPEPRRIALETAEYLAAELTAPEGVLWSAVDAETDGHEGAYYVWTRPELDRVLGVEDAQFLAPLLGFDGPPFFEGSHYVLHLPVALAAQAAKRRGEREQLLAEMAPLRAALLAARSERKRPLIDDKVLTDWNGMAIAGLAVAGRLLDAEDLVARARKAAETLLGLMRPGEGPLHHVWRAGRLAVPGLLSDYVHLARALLELAEADSDPRWRELAMELTEEQIERLGDPAGGFFAAADSPDVLVRSKEVFDGATPATNAVAALNLIELHRQTGEGRWLDTAASALRAFGGMMELQPDGARMLSVAARRFAEAAGDEPAAEGAAAAGASALTAEARDTLRARGRLGREAGGWRPFEVELQVAPGWHVQANPASEDFLVATEVRAPRPDQLRNVRYPSGRRVSAGGAAREIAVYDGTFRIRGELAVAAAATLEVRFQPCDDRRCLPPAALSVALEER